MPGAVARPSGRAQQPVNTKPSLTVGLLPRSDEATVVEVARRPHPASAVMYPPKSAKMMAAPTIKR